MAWMLVETIGSLQLSALKVQEKGTVNVEKGRPFVQIKVGGQELQALLDTGASHNFLTEKEAKRLGIPYEKEMGWLKAVNSTPNLIHGVARDTKVRIEDWHGTLDFFVVSMDDYQCILGVEFVDRAKAIPMIFANSMCITEGGELRLLLKVTMADQSDITLGVGVALTVVEHEGGRRKGRGKSKEPSRAREDLGDLEKRLAKVELHLVDGEEKFEEMDTRLMELDGRMEELQGDMQGALNAAIDKLASEGESLRLSHMGEYAALRDENRSLKEQLDRAMGKLKEVEQQVSLVAMAVARGGVATASKTSLVIPSRVEVQKPSVYSGARNAKEIDNFLWSLEQYFRAIGITDDAKKVDHEPLYLVDTAMVWRRRHGDMEKGLCTIASWDEFKRELKR
ncbi:hypothetical protein GH714_013750 [Hevea brasiliensis]|uniref:Peptidase A2 domain-containing protein n=1 Tax=Hevea brasiliensis TaxID=3981 RepID=A0A6A6KDY4_HEVBR|nr:hypothetical protein GH714_013750 [Hevea brasiliensis]